MASDPLAEAFLHLIREAEGPDAALDRPGLYETPRRAAAAWRELIGGPDEEFTMTTFDAEGEGIVTEGPIPFFSLCEHHLLPFWGEVHFAYLPEARQLGLSKFARMARHYSRRLQTQERLTKEMAHRLEEAVAPKGVLVITKAQHMCMQMRGVCSLGSLTTVSEALGEMRESGSVKGEAMRLLGV